MPPTPPSRRRNGAQKIRHNRWSYLQNTRATNIAAVVRASAPPLDDLVAPPEVSQAELWAHFVDTPARRLTGAHQVYAERFGSLPTIAEAPAYNEAYELAGSTIVPTEDGSYAGAGSRRSIARSSHVDLGDGGQRVPSTETRNRERISIYAGSDLRSPVARSFIAGQILEEPSVPSTEPRIDEPLPSYAGDQFASGQREDDIWGESSLSPESGLDCPIRAGPSGRRRCNWKPSNEDRNGLADFSRMKEHVGKKHGYLCPDCDCVFIIPTKYKDHRQNRVASGVCSALGLDKSRFPSPLDLPPDRLIAFFDLKAAKGASTTERWMDGYKILHPNWEKQGHLPSPYYLRNVGKEDAGSSSSSGNTANGPSDRDSLPSRKAANPGGTSSGSFGKDTRTWSPNSVVSRIFTTIEADNANQNSANDTMLDADWTEYLNNVSNDHFDSDMPTPIDIEMSGALPNEDVFREQSGGLGGRISQTPLLPIGSSASAPDDGMRHDSIRGHVDSQPKGPTLATHNPYRLVAHSRHASGAPGVAAALTMDVDDETGHETRDEPTSPPKEGNAAHARKQSTPNHAKQSSRSSTPHHQKRKNALKHIDKLTSEVVELCTKVQKLNTVNQDLHARLGVVENEKQTLVIALMQIRREVMRWDCEVDSEETLEVETRLDLLTRSMEKIRSALPE